MYRTLWDKFYSNGAVSKGPSQEIVKLVPYLKSSGVSEILDAGCGTGRHSNFLASLGFNVHAIDISERAIRIAKAGAKETIVDYRIGKLADLPFHPNSMDFILASHSLEYAPDRDIEESVRRLNSALKPGKLILVRVVSNQHVFCNAVPEQIYGFSHVGFCIKNGLPVHFFSQEELMNLFKNYRIERLEHAVHEKIGHKSITIPLKEWVLLGYKLH